MVIGAPGEIGRLVPSAVGVQIKPEYESVTTHHLSMEVSTVPLTAHSQNRAMQMAPFRKKLQESAMTIFVRVSGRTSHLFIYPFQLYVHTMV